MYTRVLGFGVPKIKPQAVGVAHPGPPLYSRGGEQHSSRQLMLIVGGKSTAPRGCTSRGDAAPGRRDARTEQTKRPLLLRSSGISNEVADLKIAIGK